MTGEGTRLAARAIDALIELILVAMAAPFLRFPDRPLTTWFCVWLVLLAYESLTTARFGRTPGKAILGLRTVGLDATGHPSLGDATRRGAVSATFAALPIVGWILWALPVLSDPLGRGIPDRTAATMVIPKRAQVPVSTQDLPGYADGARPPRLTTFGRVGDPDVRGRARLRRLVDAPLLGTAVGLLALAATLPVDTVWIVLASSFAWILLFVFDETRRVHRTGQTAGHALAGLVILDRRLGTAPGWWRSSVRAVVLALTLYVPPLWLFLLASVALMRWTSQGRGLHDLAAGTIVVGDPRLAPEAQRQRAMRMRLGKAA